MFPDSVLKREVVTYYANQELGTQWNTLIQAVQIDYRRATRNLLTAEQFRWARNSLSGFSTDAPPIDLQRFMQQVTGNEDLLGVINAMAEIQQRVRDDSRDTAEYAGRLLERLKSDTARNLSMFEETLPAMKENLVNVKALFRALEAGTMASEDAAQIEMGIVNIDVVPSYPLVFAGYEELVATGRLRQLNDPVLIDLLGNQRAEYEAAQAVVGYWRDNVQGATNALDQYVEYYFTTEQMDESGMGVRFDFTAISDDRFLKNNVFDAVDIHGDWLRLQTSIHEITREIESRLYLQ